MPTYYDSNGHPYTVSDRATPTAPALVTNDTTGHFVGVDPSDPRYEWLHNTEDDGLIARLNGPPPDGYKYMADGSLKKIGWGEKLQDFVMSPKGFATIGAGMVVGPAIYSALAGGGAAGAGAAGATLPSSAIATGAPALAPTVTGSMGVLGGGAAAGTAAGVGGAAAGTAAATLPSSAIATGAPALAPTVAGTPGAAAATYLPGHAIATGAPAMAPTLGGAAAKGTGMSALITVAGISAGSNLLGSWLQARGAQKAADAQTAAAEKSLALQKEMYQQSRSDLSPYMSAGSGATSTLAGLMGIPMNPVPNTMSPAGATTGPGHYDTTGRWIPPDSPVVGTAVPRKNADGTDMVSPTRGLPPDPRYVSGATEPITRAAAQQQVAQQQNASSYVPMKAPDGSVAQVPESQVNTAIRRGATRL